MEECYLSAEDFHFNTGILYIVIEHGRRLDFSRALIDCCIGFAG